MVGGFLANSRSSRPDSVEPRLDLGIIAMNRDDSGFYQEALCAPLRNARGVDVAVAKPRGAGEAKVYAVRK